jgi:hypothetical protein
MSNCSQVNNITIHGTSAVTYDSTPLPCTDVKACDDLNTILTKFDNVICSAINSVNILTEEVMNITEDLMIITEEIENINDQIFICCPICDFTGTADQLPDPFDCNFTGVANQLPDPTTTTTTTLALSCIEVELNVGTNCPDESFALFQYIDCSGNEQIVEVGTGDLPRFCVLDTPYPSFVCGDGTITLVGECETTTTTTTTVPPTTTTTSTSTSTSTSTTTTSTTTAPVYTYAGTIRNNTANTITAETAIIKVNGSSVAFVTLNIAPGATQTFSTTYSVPVSGIGNDFTIELYTYTGVTTSNTMKQEGGDCVTSTGSFVNMGTYLRATSTTTGPSICSVYVIAMTIS